MIISASYKTDIPTFYGDWFMTRLRTGHCRMTNPYNRRAIRVSLKNEDVDGFVFWTKNIAPFLKHLPEIRQRGFPFIIQHTINAYPRELENAVVDPGKSIDNLKRIANDFGPGVCVWRYDPIVISSLTPPAFHLKNFETIAKKLRGAVDEVTLSFAQIYRKTLRNMNTAAAAHNFTWQDPADAAKRQMTIELATIAKSNGMTLSICSQRSLLTPATEDARCIDARRLQDIAGHPITAPLKGNRKECGCHQSRDIGEYDTCPHGCVYCYAVQTQPLAQLRFKQHDPNSEFLFNPVSSASCG